MRVYCIGFTVGLILSACGGGGGTNTSQSNQHTYFKQGGLTWSETLSGSLPGGQFYWAGVAKFTSDSAAYQCNGVHSVNGGPFVPDNFNGEAGWELPTTEQLKSLYAENKNPTNWTIGLVWAQGLTGPDRLDFSTGKITSGNGSTGLVACVKASK